MRSQEMRPDLKAQLYQNICGLFENKDFADVSIEVGPESNTKTYKVHSAILAIRSKYFATALSDIWVKREDNHRIVRELDIIPEIFEIILKYLYTGDVNISELGVPTILDLLVAADKLLLTDLIEYLELDLLESHSESLKQNFARLRETAFRSDLFKRLQKFCTDINAENPEAIFKSKDFTQLPIKELTAIIARDDLDMEESEIWDCLVKWGAAQIDPDDPVARSPDNFSSFHEKIKECMPLIRFFNMSSAEFHNKVMPFAKILPETLYKDLQHHYLVKSHDEKVKPRAATKRTISQLVTDQQMAQVESWIYSENTLTSKNLPSLYKFNLLLRGSRDGFTPEAFHKLCDGKGPTVTVIKVKGSDKVVGGYTPQSWSSDIDRMKSGINSFIFSFGDRKPVLSRYVSGGGIHCGPAYGPIFGCLDLALKGENFQTSDTVCCRKNSYKYGIMNDSESLEGSETKFFVDDYEVFLVTDVEDNLTVSVNGS